MQRRVAWPWLVVWGAFVAYAAAFSPPDDPALTRALVRGTFTGDFGPVDPAIASVFSALGVIPVLASAFVLRAGAGRRLPAWPFALAMFVAGAFALLPWLALRDALGPRATPRPPGPVRRFLARRLVGAAIAAALVAFGVWGVFRGHASAYARAFASASLVHVMTIDLVVCAVLVMVLVEEARRDLDPSAEPAAARAARLIPLLGSAVWAALVRRLP